MIDDAEIRKQTADLGVPEAQVRRDHLLSHLIAAIPQNDRVIFFGGTALNRTHLPDLRLSEDLDVHLIEGDAELLVQGLVEGVRLEYPSLSVVTRNWSNDVGTFLLRADDLSVRTQIVTHRPAWEGLPVQATPVRLRYSDLAASVDLYVPTIEAFGALKLAAYVDRRAPRDLFDLRYLAEQGALNEASLGLLQNLLGRRLTKHEFEFPPDETEWGTELSHQVTDPGTAADALDIVRRVLREQLSW
jgi:predicted nucleotidyltransferase component of viral defense system